MTSEVVGAVGNDTLAGDSEASTCTVALDAFSGPLDLLLYLVRRAEVDIIDIPVAQIADQFVAAVDAWAEIDLDAAGDFILMAASLLELKARLVAPPLADAAPDEAEEEVIDLRAGLVGKLLAYRRCKEAALALERLEEEHRPRLARQLHEAIPEDPDEVGLDLENADPYALAASFEAVMARILGLGPRTVVADPLPLESAITLLIHTLQGQGEERLSRLLETQPTRLGRVTVLMAVLECARQRLIEVVQPLQYGEVTLRFRHAPERDAVAALPPPEPEGPKRRKRPPLMTWAGAASDAEHDGAAEEEPIETDEQRFSRELEESCALEATLTRAADIEGAFAQFWAERRGLPWPPPPPPVASAPTAPAVPPAAAPAPLARRPRQRPADADRAANTPAIPATAEPPAGAPAASGSDIAAGAAPAEPSAGASPAEAAPAAAGAADAATPQRPDPHAGDGDHAPPSASAVVAAMPTAQAATASLAVAAEPLLSPSIEAAVEIPSALPVVADSQAAHAAEAAPVQLAQPNLAQPLAQAMSAVRAEGIAVGISIEIAIDSAVDNSPDIKDGTGSVPALSAPPAASAEPSPERVVVQEALHLAAIAPITPAPIAPSRERAELDNADPTPVTASLVLPSAEDPQLAATVLPPGEAADQPSAQGAVSPSAASSDEAARSLNVERPASDPIGLQDGVALGPVEGDVADDVHPEGAAADDDRIEAPLPASVLEPTAAAAIVEASAGQPAAATVAAQPPEIPPPPVPTAPVPPALALAAPSPAVALSVAATIRTVPEPLGAPTLPAPWPLAEVIRQARAAAPAASPLAASAAPSAAAMPTPTPTTAPRPAVRTEVLGPERAQASGLPSTRTRGTTLHPFPSPPRRATRPWRARAALSATLLVLAGGWWMYTHHHEPAPTLVEPPPEVMRLPLGGPASMGPGAPQASSLQIQDVLPVARMLAARLAPLFALPAAPAQQAPASAPTAADAANAIAQVLVRALAIEAWFARTFPEPAIPAPAAPAHRPAAPSAAIPGPDLPRHAPAATAPIAPIAPAPSPAAADMAAAFLASLAMDPAALAATQARAYAACTPLEPAADAARAYLWLGDGMTSASAWLMLHDARALP